DLLAGPTSPGPASTAANPVEIATELLQVSADSLRGLANGCRHVSGTEDRGTARAKNPRLLAADRLAVAAQPVAVIEIDRRDQCDVGVDDVHRIEPSAHAHFEHDRIETGVGEYQQRCGGVEFEERQSVVAASSIDALEGSHQRLVGHLVAIDHDALVVAQQMGRSESANAVAGLTKDARSQRDTRPFAVSASDRDDRAGRTLPSQTVERALQAIEPEIDRVR